MKQNQDKPRKGKFYGVGVGPGDPSLITLRAVEILQVIQVIAIPKSKMERESVAWEIAKSHCPSGVNTIELEMPMTTDEDLLQAAWQKAAERIKAELDQGHSVAFLTLGDLRCTVPTVTCSRS